MSFDWECLRLFVFKIEGENTVHYFVVVQFVVPSGYIFYIISSFIWVLTSNGRHLRPFQQPHKWFAIHFEVSRITGVNIFRNTYIRFLRIQISNLFLKNHPLHMT